jgi:ATP-dependent Clp protease ATP-binding subunit ClpB
MQLKKFSQAAQKVLIQCRLISKKNHNLSVEPEHLTLALMMTAELKELLSKKNVDYKALENALLKLISNLPIGLDRDPPFSPRLIQALSSAEALSIKRGHENTHVGDLFLSLIENKDKYGALGTVLAKFFLGVEDGIKKHETLSAKTEEKSLLFRMSDNINDLIKNEAIDPVFGREEEVARLIQVLSRKTRNNPILIGEPGVGRTSIVYMLTKRIIEQKIPTHLISKEILALDIGALLAGTSLRGQFEERMSKILFELSERQGHYILLIRDLSMLSGAGGEGASDATNLLKPGLAKGTIQLIGLVTPSAYKKRIEIDPSFERYFQPIFISPPSLKECQKILMGLREKYEQFHGVFIEDDAIKAAVELGARHISGRFLPELAIDVLDEACSRHRIMIDERPLALTAISEQLMKIEIELTKKEHLKRAIGLKKEKEKLENLLKNKTKNYEKELLIIESMRAIKKELLELKKQVEQEKSKRDIKKAADIKHRNTKELQQEFLKRQKELLNIKKSERLIDPFVKRDDIAAVISQETGIPVKKMMQSEREKLAQMENILSLSVIGQKEAIKAVANAIRRARVGLKDPKKPIGSFLFLGPTGVGKTELARTLTNFLFDDEKAMVRFDMSEFMERHSVARLIGAPPGYQGSEEGGQLTENIRRKPYAVVLFDEIEKAHADVLNVLLQVLDEGRLTDSQGHLVEFSNTVIIMTSNVGADILLQEELTVDKDSLKNLILKRLFAYLRPELINRIDEIVIFNAIDRDGIKEIAELMLKKAKERLEQEGFELVIEQKVKHIIIDAGYSREFGARPLKRAIQQLIENPLALELIQSRFKKGDVIEAYAIKDDRIEFRSR